MVEEPVNPEQFFNAISPDQQSAEKYANLARLYLQQQQWQKAIANYRYAIEINPSCSWFYHHLADIFLQVGQWQDAIANYRHAIELNPNFSWSYHNLGNALLKVQQWEEAVSIYQKAIQLEPNFHWSYCNLGDAFVQLQKTDLAIPEYWQSINLLHQNFQEQDAPVIYPKLGEALEQCFQGNINAALAYCRQIIQDSQQSISYQNILNFLQNQKEKWLNLGDFFLQEHFLIAALMTYGIVIEVDPNDLSSWHQFNTILAKLNQLEQQIERQRQQAQKTPQKWLNYEGGIVETISEINLNSEPNSEQVIFSTDHNLDLNQLNELFELVGWFVRPQDQMKIALEHSFLVVSVWYVTAHQKQLIGFARAISDHVFNATLWDVVIHPNFQNQGLGKTLIQYTLDQLHQKNIDNITLFAGAKAVNFYHNLGFIADPNGVKGMFWIPN